MPPASAQRLSRLLNLYALLTETNRPLTAKQIREQVDADYGPNDAAFRRNFERDKEELRALGVDIRIEEVLDGEVPEQGYVVPRSARALRVPDLDADEVAALHLAVSLVRLDGSDVASGLWKLGAVGGEAGTEGLAALPAHPQLGPLFTAVVDRRTARFGYRGEPRVVDPYRLDFARGRWYLLAHDHDRGAERWFRLDRLDGAPSLGPVGGFEAPDSSRESVPDPWSMAVDDPVTARVAFDPGAGDVARSILGDRAVVDERDDGGVVVELEVSHRDGFRSFVLGFGERAEVLAPAELRDDVVRWLRGVAEA